MTRSANRQPPEVLPAIEPVVAVVVAGDQRMALTRGDVTQFGRAENLGLRMGHTDDDRLVPPVAGSLVVQGDRVVVVNEGSHLAHDIAVPRRPLLPLVPGDWHAPADPAFSVVVWGAVRRYKLQITLSRRDGAGVRRNGNDLVDLTGRQRQILDAYLAPTAEGLAQASHRQVSEAVGWGRQTIRNECSVIHEKILSSGIPMRDSRDARDAITDAWGRHYL